MRDVELDELFAVAPELGACFGDLLVEELTPFLEQVELLGSNTRFTRVSGREAPCSEEL